MTDGVVDGKYQIQELLDTHFDRVLAVCKQAQMIESEPLVYYCQIAHLKWLKTLSELLRGI